MAQLQQLVYISRAAFGASRQGLGVEPEVGRILVQSRLNNPRRGLVGALYYGDGCFFQCLEGPSEAIDALYADLLADPRHRDLKVLHRRSIPQLSFREWAMKYVPGAQAVRALLKKHGLRKFDPYHFDQDTIRDMLDLLQRGADGKPGDAAGDASAAGGGSRLRAGALVTLALLAAALAIGYLLH